MWVVGAKGLICYFDGCQWDIVDVGIDVDLWWVIGFDDGSVIIVGLKGMIICGGLG